MFLSDCIFHQHSSFRIIVNKTWIDATLVFFLGTVRITHSGSQEIGEILVLKCTISDFSKTASWWKDETPITTCTKAVCFPEKYENVTTFSHGNNYIEVTFDTVDSSIFGEWKCTHLSGSKSFNVTGSKCLITFIFKFIVLHCIYILQCPKFVLHRCLHYVRMRKTRDVILQLMIVVQYLVENNTRKQSQKTRLKLVI